MQEPNSSPFPCPTGSSHRHRSASRKRAGKPDVIRRATWRFSSLLLIASLTAGLSGCGKSEGHQAASLAKHAATDPNSQELVGQSINDIPDTGLINERGEAASFAGLPNEPILLTFIYTRCPMANMCPLITQKVSQVQQRLAASGVSARFVEVSFDPEYDTPAVLRAYADSHGLDTKDVTLWTGTPEAIKSLTEHFRITTDRQSDQVIMHNMRTFLIGPDHVIRCVYRRSDWPVDEVTRVLAAMASPNQS